MSILATDFERTSYDVAERELTASFSSYKEVKKYLTLSEEQRENFVRSAQDPTLASSLSYNRWQTCWLKAKSSLYNLVARSCESCLPKVSQTCRIYSKQVNQLSKFQELEQICQERLLVHACNVPQGEDADFYLHPTIEIRASLHNSSGELKQCKRELLDFSCKLGVCAGMCMWFSSLYFQTRDLFEDPKEHLKAVARCFERGAPRQAGMLQLIQNAANTRDFNLTCDALDLQIQSVQLPKDILYSVMKDPPPAHQTIKALDPGIYQIDAFKHRINYVKIDEERGYIFDPNIGLQDISDDQAGCLVYILKSYGENPDLKFHEMEIYFKKVAPANEERPYTCKIGLEEGSINALLGL